jgi:AAA15 family ATPase/GTPase
MQSVIICYISANNNALIQWEPFMLIEFTVGNFRSFQEPETFSMVAANLTSADPKLDTENVIPVGKDLSLLTSAAIYGRNSSGKSNLAAALRFMRQFVLSSSRDSQATDAIPTEPFRLSTETRDQPSFFEIVFLVEGKRYRYGFEVDTQRVVSEWLFTVPTIREALLFQREGNEFQVTSRFKEGRGLQERTRANALFLSVIAQFNGETGAAVIEWMKQLSIFGADNWRQTYTAYNLIADKPYKDRIIDLLKRFDLDILDVVVDPNLRARQPNYIGQDLTDEGNRDLYPFLLAHQNSMKTTHGVYDAQHNKISVESFDLDAQESEGTKRLFAMAGPLVDSLDLGKTLFIDEIDIKLHPLITRAIISLFNSKETNPKGAQLIFATHDANLLDNTLLRRDQIWFMEKDRYGASHLVSLAEYRIRKEADFEKNYLQGRYGGVPSLGDVSQLFEEAHA